MSREFIYRHHEEPRLKFYEPDNETLSIPLNYVDAVRQTTSINNVSEHVISDTWAEADGVTLTEERAETSRLQILRTRLLEGYRVIGGIGLLGGC